VLIVLLRVCEGGEHALCSPAVMEMADMQPGACTHPEDYWGQRNELLGVSGGDRQAASRHSPHGVCVSRRDDHVYVSP
jgi:hypothetical protein